jgi:hypothetical protein
MDITPKKVHGVWVSVNKAQVKNGQWISFSAISAGPRKGGDEVEY